MERLTMFDEVRGCYVIKPEAPQGQVIQMLGKYEAEADWLLRGSLDHLSDAECRFMLYDLYSRMWHIQNDRKEEG